MKHLSKLVISLAILSVISISSNAHAARVWLFTAAQVESVEMHEGYLVVRIDGVPTSSISCAPTLNAGAIRLYTTDAWPKAQLMSIALAAQSTGKRVDVWAEDTSSCNQDGNVMHYATDTYPDAENSPGMGLPFYGLRVREN